MALAPPRIFSATLVFFFTLSASLAEASESDRILQEDSSASRESFRFEGDVAWIVQISDLHISSYHPDRAEDLKRLLAPALRVIRPSLLLITGDITDAKNEDRTTTRQDESEWIQYMTTMDAVINESGMDRRAIFDLRGNHDKYGVPYVGSKLDFFSSYSISSQLNRLSTVQSISLVGKDWKYVFVGIDDSMSIGLRGPSNLFGHLSDKRIEIVESELGYWDHHPSTLVTKVVFGHFPMSFLASSENGNRYESMFARQSVSTYLCGHLHAKFSKQLWKLHANESRKPENMRQFWEWEIGDWKESKLMRILAIDRGRVSFVDIDLRSSHKPNEDFQTAILVTHPIDSRSMSRVNSCSHFSANDIRALVFSIKPLLNVTAKIFDSTKNFKLVEELLLHATSFSNQQSLFHTKWNAGNYANASASRFWLQVLVVDIHGKETASTLRPFSVEGRLARMPKTMLAHLVFHVRWETLYPFLLWSNVSFLIVLLCLPKLLNHFMVQNVLYQKWAMLVSVSLPIAQTGKIFWPLWLLIEGSRNRKLWCAMVLYILYLLTFPWFWGHATSEGGEIASMSMHGWTIQFSDISIRKDGVGTPDVMAITLPFMYLLVSPLFLLIYGLLSERSAFYLHGSRKSICSLEQISSKMDSVQRLQFTGSTPSKSSMGKKMLPSCKICQGWIRTALLLACLVIAYIHFRICSSLMRAYGGVAVSLSPAISWVPPILLVVAVYSSQSAAGSHHRKM